MMPLSRGACGGFSGNGGLVGECMLQNLQETKTPDEKSQTSGNQRHLQQSSSTVIEVSNGAQLVQAVAQGVKDIVITEHIDLTALPLPLQQTGICEVGCESPLGLVNGTRSIRGRCDSAPSTQISSLTPPLQPLKPGQCILLGQEDLIPIASRQIWLDNLYLRAVFRNVPQPGPTRKNSFITLAAVAPYEDDTVTAVRYLTNMTLQGDDKGPTVGVFGDEKVYVEDSLFSHLGGSQRSDCPECAGAVQSRATAVSLKSCTFQDLYAAPGSRYILAFEAGAVRAEDCVFGPAIDPFEARAGASFYSDDPTLEVQVINGQPLQPPKALSDIPEPTGGEVLFLTRDDKWFAELRNELTGEPLPPSLAVAPGPGPPIINPPPPPPPRERKWMPIVAGSVAAVIAAILVVMSVLVYLRMNNRKKKEQEKRDQMKQAPAKHDEYKLDELQRLEKGLPSTGYSGSSSSHAQAYSNVPGSAHGSMHGSLQKQAMGSGPDIYAKYSNQNGSGLDQDSWMGGGKGSGSGSHAPNYTGSGSFHHPYHGPMQANLAPGLNISSHQSFGGSSGYGSAARGRRSTADTFYDTVDQIQGSGMTSMTGTAVQPPTENASIAERLEFLHSQLDTLGNTHVLMDRFVLLGQSHRRHGGQGLVAFARGAYDQLEYAIKFFVVRKSFEAELDLYQSQALGSLLPQVEAVYDPMVAEEPLTDRRGTPLPAFLVMEKGESLSDWSERARPDLFQSIAVLVNVATRLRDLHAAGYVHRDIKPGNIMFLPRKNSWTVIDFGCTARSGEQAPLFFTMSYSPPEVVASYNADEKTIAATEALDSWALGVVAFELLTGAPAFPLFMPKEKIMRQLRGDDELPWEGEQGVSARKKLGIFRQPILALLQREPSERKSLAAFCKSCQDVFSSTSTVTMGFS